MSTAPYLTFVVGTDTTLLILANHRADAVILSTTDRLLLSMHASSESIHFDSSFRCCCKFLSIPPQLPEVPVSFFFSLFLTCPHHF
jgi:hypothetical protein